MVVPPFSRHEITFGAYLVDKIQGKRFAVDFKAPADSLCRTDKLITDYHGVSGCGQTGLYIADIVNKVFPA